MTNSWRFWIDRGGTFTDIVGCAPDGELHTLKLLSENRAHYRDAAAEGIRRVLDAAPHAATVAEIRMGTTVATNALLEKTGAATGLLTSRGFRDVLRIGEQNRPDIFALQIKRPAMLYREVAEISERMSAAGEVLEDLQLAEVETTLRSWRDRGIESVAISFLHAWANSAHERAVAELARSMGFGTVAASHEVSPLLKIVSRTNTTVVDAYLSPVLVRYVRGFQEELRSHGIECPRILFMQSNGGLVTAELFRGKDSILSGPAGGVVGMGAAAKQAGIENLLGFDMGGTSTDVSLLQSAPEIADETVVEGMQLRSPMIRIHTIAAGGGSILRFADGRFQVGPASAGAAPGPKSYGHGGPLTVTDANLMLGRIQAEWFPQVFGPTADQPLDRASVVAAFEALARELQQQGFSYSPEAIAAGFLDIAVDNMANAVARISVQRGLDPADFTLCCFGGAGGQHACEVAERLGIRRILLDPLAPVLSAWGMGAAEFRSYRQLEVNVPFDAETFSALKERCAELQCDCDSELAAQGIAAGSHNRWFYMQAADSNTSLPVTGDSLAAIEAAFRYAHRAAFGFVPDDTQLIVAAIRVEAESRLAETVAPDRQQLETERAKTEHTCRTWLDDDWQTLPVFVRDELPPGTELNGPALIVETNSSTLLTTGWSATVNQSRQLLLERVAAKHAPAAESDAVDPVRLEIFNNHFMYVAEEMGAVLQKTARSVNIKERLDFSCALFTPAGELIANAPHVPVHLGSMDDSVKALLRDHHDDLLHGTSFLTNAPYNGGTHLPDVTVITPVLDAHEALRFIVASRAHHADIGGITPGSMPPESAHIDEEGVVFDNVPLVHEQRFLADDIRARLRDAPYPARNPEQNIADFKAQLAANERGRGLLLELLSRHGDAVVQAYTQHVQDNAEETVRCAIERLSEGAFCYPFDNGQQIQVAIRIDRKQRSAVIDFTGTSAVSANNLNAPVSVCQAAVLYVFRTLVNSNIPLNAGCRRPLQLIVPAGCMLNPAYPAAVVGGNVETSQCITDALYGALGVLAASQGTMNNLSFGNDEFQYYETIGGGTGAGPAFAGAAAVQSHMTNSRMTDAEVLESRYPVLVREFAVRNGSGGHGLHRGGDGAIRKLEFREAMSAAILSNHRKVAPFGLNGGQAGQTGRNSIVRKSGATERFDGIMQTQVGNGDLLIIETPGGGGYGRPRDES